MVSRMSRRRWSRMPNWVVGDLGCGTGQTTAALAPYVSTVIAIDESSAMLNAARKRLGPYRSGERAAFRDKDVRSLIRAGFSFALAAATIDHPAAIHDDVGEAEKADQAHDS